jgi:hypothetical protein
MNEKQKRLIPIFLTIVVLSGLFVPTEMSWIMGGGGDWNPKTQFIGYRFIWDMKGEIALKHLLVEWVALAVVYLGMYFYLKEQDES